MLEPSRWVLTADSLLASAACLEPHASRYWLSKSSDQKISEGYLKTQLMLAGFALENMMKALIVQGSPDRLWQEFISKKELPKALRSHNLIALAEKAGLRFGDDGTKELLERLTRHSVWAGRYHVPIDPDDAPAEDFFNVEEALAKARTETAEVASEPKLICVSAYVKQDWENSQRLFQRAKVIIETRKKTIEQMDIHASHKSP